MRDALIRSSSTWSGPTIRQYLRSTEIPVRLACLSSTGAPLLVSLWFYCDDEAIWCATPQSAAVVRWLENDPRCAFEIAGDQMPYCGVRGQGSARLSREEGPRVLQRLIDRYLHSRDSGFARWLLARQDDEMAIRIEPAWLTSWDFSARMKP